MERKLFAVSGGIHTQHALHVAAEIGRRRETEHIGNLNEHHLPVMAVITVFKHIEETAHERCILCGHPFLPVDHRMEIKKIESSTTGNAETHPEQLSLPDTEHPCKGALKALLGILVMVAGDKFKTGLDRMG